MVSDQHRRRHDPYPWTWEIPAAAIAAVLLVMVGGIHLGRAVANVVAGAGWHLTARKDLFSSLPGILGGHAGAGLARHVRPVASPALLAGCSVTVEVVLLAVLVFSARYLLGRWGPGRMKGMASRAEAEQLLGPTRLRRNAPTIRPDLYANVTNREPDHDR